MNKILSQDIESIYDSIVNWESFRGKTILVTGATGLIGSLLVRSLINASRKDNLGIKVVAVIRNVEKAKSLFGNSAEITYCVYDFSGNERLVVEDAVDFIIHTASMTASKEFLSNPVENVKIAVNGTLKIMDLAVEKKSQGVVYLSSMEAYGQMNVEDHLVHEDELGTIDLTSVRSCYPEAKRMCECICKAYAVQHGLNVVSARLAQTFGPGIARNENRVFAQFAKSAIEGNDIVLRTEGLSEGNYVYTVDAIIAILTLLLKGEKGVTYNIVNSDNHMRIRDMAELVANEIAGGKIKVVFDIPEDKLSTGYAADTKMHLSSDRINTLGWTANVSLKDMYSRTIDYLMEEAQEDASA